RLSSGYADERDAEGAAPPAAPSTGEKASARKADSGKPARRLIIAHQYGTPSHRGSPAAEKASAWPRLAVLLILGAPLPTAAPGPRPTRLRKAPTAPRHAG